jgi:hypothetical protein
MISALLRIQDYLAAEQIRFEDATAEARELAQLELPELLIRETWPKFAILCWVRLNGEVVPTKALFDAPEFAMAMPRRWADDLVPLFLPDVIGAKRICGRAPEIVQAERMIPIGKRELRSVRLPSGISFNPEEDDIFCTLVEEGERLRRGDGAWKNVPEAVRETLYPGWKAGNLGLAYGLFAQTNVIDKPVMHRRRSRSCLTKASVAVEHHILRTLAPSFACRSPRWSLPAAGCSSR